MVGLTDPVRAFEGFAAGGQGHVGIVIACARAADSTDRLVLDDEFRGAIVEAAALTFSATTAASITLLIKISSLAGWQPASLSGY